MGDKMSRNFTLALAAGLALALPGAAMAAGANAGVQAGFFALGQDIQTVLQGAGGFVILIISVVFGGAAYAITGRPTLVLAALGVAVFLGYGVQVMTSFSGVTATTGMLNMAALDATSLDSKGLTETIQ